MKKQLVYDLPTRIFHWLFAGLFIAAFLIAKTIDDDSPVFSYHMLAGLMLGFLVILRLVWGLFGSKYAKFSSFALHPGELLSYFKGIVSGDKKKWPGHNPASSWAALAMMGFALGLGITGYLMASGQKESFEDLHELLANGFLVVVLLHIAGVLLHALRHRDGIALSMIHGQKNQVTPEAGISSTGTGVALLLIVLLSAFSMYLAKNFNSQTRILNFFGTSLELGESEENEGNKKEESGEKEYEGEEDED